MWGRQQKLWEQVGFSGTACSLGPACPGGFHQNPGGQTHQASDGAFPHPRQEIDGKALLLLRSDMMMKYMGLKLGPALKLSFHIDRLKQGKF